MKMEFRKLILVLPCLCLSVLAGQPFASGQDRVELQVQSAPGYFSDKEEEELLRKLRETPELPLRFDNTQPGAVEILSASVRAVRRDPRYYQTDIGSAAYATDHAMQVSLTVRNTTTGAIFVGLKFTNQETRHVFFVGTKKIPLESGGRLPIRINLMAVAGNPSGLQVEATGIGDEGALPGWYSRLPSAAGLSGMPRPHNPQVDTKPRPLNRLRPSYTEQARRNKVMGAVRLLLLVGSDGVVKKVEVVNALPDGLTEEAIKLARVLQFQPARKDGVAVEYSVPLDIEFDLR